VFGRRTTPPGLHRCCVCHDDSVVPVWWEALDTDEIATSLERSDRERMAAELQVFVAALEHDLIDAADFASR
jgi:hypothetical protein